jgi:hypothetical protein
VVGAFISDLEAAGKGSINVAKLTSDANAIGAACASQSAPDGALGTGGGSTTGVVGPALFGVGRPSRYRSPRLREQAAPRRQPVITAS